MDLTLLTICLAIGCGIAAGLLAGLFGVGGGVIFVPTLVLVFAFTQLDAQATSLAAIIPVAAVGAWRQTSDENVYWRGALIMGIGAAVGVLFGAEVATHAIGDLAVHATMDAYRDAALTAPPVRPMRVEHAQIVGPKDRRRFHDEGVIASMQPTHLTSDMPWVPARLGPLRIPWGYAWKPILEEGATLALLPKP